MAGLLDEVGVHDDAVALIAVADGAELAVGVAQLIGVGVEFLGDRGVGQVEGIVAPLLDGVLVADDEEGRSRGLVHLAHEGLVVGTGSGGDDLDGHAGLLGVHLGDFLQHLVRLGLEVQPVDGAVGGVARGLGRALSGLLLAAAACEQREAENQRQNQCKCFLHGFVHLLFKLYVPQGHNSLLYII